MPWRDPPAVAAHYDLGRDIVVTFNPADDPAAGHLPLDVNDLDKLLEKYKKAT
ncbi:hypothetical protein [Mesorhizobium sp. B2-3-11]|uniref:hypothetical protein n=1 Tax=Mesorhizobium sp. B2-3-11 TaxID=2589953 RepID=UPI0015E421A9|nr:hypothetical protein [Mesorhizobium sp. B2-3-11]